MPVRHVRPQPRSRASRVMTRVIWAAEGGGETSASRRAGRHPGPWPEQPPPGAGRVGTGGLHDRGGGDQQQHKILGDEILAECATALAWLITVPSSSLAVRAELLDLLVSGQRHGQQIGQAAVPGLQFADPLGQTPRTRPMGQARLAPAGRPQRIRRPCPPARRQPASPGWETAESAWRCPRWPGGDRLERRFQPLLGEHLPGHRNDGRPVARGIGPQPRLVRPHPASARAARLLPCSGW